MRLLAAALAAFLIQAGPAAAGWKEIKPKIAAGVVRNPDNGLAFMPQLAPVETVPEWILDACSIAYFRLDWADVVDESGAPKFAELDRSIFEGYRKRGLKLSFRIMAANPHSRLKYVTPKVVLDRYGIPTVTHTSVYGETQVDPVFWDQRFVSAYSELTAALGGYLDGQRWAGPVDLGGMGDWGEMHLGRWTAADLEANGFTSEWYFWAVMEMMGAMEKHLPKVAKAFCVAPINMPDAGPVFAQIVDRGVRNGWWLRSDGCEADGPPPYVKPYVEKFWQRTGLIYEPSGGINREYHGGPVEPAAYFEANLAWHPSILNLMGMWDLKELSPAEQEACLAVSLRTGSRLVVERMVVPDQVVLRSDAPSWIPLRIAISQQGSAPYHGTVVLVIDLLQKGKRVLRREAMPVPPLSELLPGKTQEDLILIEAPPEAKPGNLDVKMVLRDVRIGPVEFANEPRDKNGWLEVCSLKAARERKAPPVLYDAVKSGGLEPSEGVTLETSAGGIRLTGTSTGGWNFANTARDFEVKPGCFYHLRAKLKAERAAGGTEELHFKFGVELADGTWGGNVTTPVYDFSKQGTVQELATLYRPGPGDAKFGIAVEKGHTGTAFVDAVIESLVVEEIPVP